MSISPTLPHPDDDLAELDEAILAPVPNLYDLFPIPHIDLSLSEQSTVEKYQLGKTILGPVASAVMTCPPAPVGNLGGPEGSLVVLALLAKNKCCPYAKSCPLLQIGKAPHGEPCPLETTYIVERFVNWSKELGSTPQTLNETDRTTCSTLTSLDLHEHRHLSILGEVDAARMTDITVSEVANNGDPIAYEKVSHASALALVPIRHERTTLLKVNELTPEMKTKKAKYASGEKGADLASLQSAKADKFREWQNARRILTVPKPT